MKDRRPTLIPSELEPAEEEERERWLAEVLDRLDATRRAEERRLERAARASAGPWHRRWLRSVRHNLIVHPLIPLVDLLDRVVGARRLVELVDRWHDRTAPHDD
jgi:hypothetical protein